MFCSGITLGDRKDYKQGKDPKKKFRSRMLEEKLFVESDYYHSYTFRWDKTKKYINDSCNETQLSVSTLSLPEDIHGFNTGSSLQRWASKRPRLKSGKKPILNYEDPPTETSEHEETFNASTLIKQYSKETEEEAEQEELSEETEEIDPDIQKLLSISQQTSTEQEEEESKKAQHKKKHKKKDGEKKPRKRTKTIKFSLSKPPSPQTVQVIRVDVTSNFSMDEEVVETQAEANLSDCTKGCGRRIRSGLEARKAVLQKNISLQVEKRDEVDLLCKKLTLKERSDENNEV